MRLVRKRITKKRSLKTIYTLYTIYIYLIFRKIHETYLIIKHPFPYFQCCESFQDPRLNIGVEGWNLMNQILSDTWPTSCLNTIPERLLLRFQNCTFNLWGHLMYLYLFIKLNFLIAYLLGILPLIRHVI